MELLHMKNAIGGLNRFVTFQLTFKSIVTVLSAQCVVNLGHASISNLLKRQNHNTVIVLKLKI